MIDRTKNLVLPLIPIEKLLLFALGIFLLALLFPTTIYAQEKSATESAVFQQPHDGYITTKFSSFHPGIDICTAFGSTVKPLEGGVVTDAGYNYWGLGLFVEVDHGDGFKSTYAHMGKIYVTKGAKVTTNDLLGVVGMTGNTTGPHTHLELSYNGVKIDPRPHFPSLRDIPKAEDFAKIESSTPSAYLVPESTTSAILTSVKESTPSSQSSQTKPEEKPQPTIENKTVSPAAVVSQPTKPTLLQETLSITKPVTTTKTENSKPILKLLSLK